MNNLLFLILIISSTEIGSAALNLYDFFTWDRGDKSSCASSPLSVIRIRGEKLSLEDFAKIADYRS